MARSNKVGSAFSQKTFLDWETCFDMMRVVRLWNNDYLRVLRESRRRYFTDNPSPSSATATALDSRLSTFNQQLKVPHGRMLRQNGYGFRSRASAVNAAYKGEPDFVYVGAGRFEAQNGAFLANFRLQNSQGAPVTKRLSKSRRTNCFSAPKQGLWLGLVRRLQPSLVIEDLETIDGRVVALPAGRCGEPLFPPRPVASEAGVFEVKLAGGQLFPDRMGDVTIEMLACLEFANVAEVVKFHNFWQHSLGEVQESLRPGDLGGMDWQHPQNPNQARGGHSVFIYQVRYHVETKPDGTRQGETWYQILSSQGDNQLNDSFEHIGVMTSDGTGVMGVESGLDYGPAGVHREPDYLEFREVDHGTWYCLESGKGATGWDNVLLRNFKNSVFQQGQENGREGVRDRGNEHRSGEAHMSAIHVCRFWRRPRVPVVTIAGASHYRLFNRRGGEDGSFLPNERVSWPAPVSTKAIEECARRISASEGNYPFGEFGNWHNGLHLVSEPHSSVHAVADGVIVAFRFAAGRFAGRSRNFILVRHDLQNYKVSNYGENPFFSLYMHLQDDEYEQEATPYEQLYWRGYGQRLSFPDEQGNAVFSCIQKGISRTLRLRVQAGELIGRVDEVTEGDFRGRGILHFEVFTASDVKYFASDNPDRGTLVDYFDVEGEGNSVDPPPIARPENLRIENHTFSGNWRLRCEHVSEWGDRADWSAFPSLRVEAEEFTWYTDGLARAAGLPEDQRITTYHPLAFLLSLERAFVDLDDEGTLTDPRIPPSLV